MSLFPPYAKSTNFHKYYIYFFITNKITLRLDEMASRVRFSPWAVIWGPCISAQCRISPTLDPPQSAYKSPLMVIYKKVFDVMLHLEASWLSENTLIAGAIWQNQARSQVLRLGGAKYILAEIF